MERTISGMVGKGSVNHNTRAFTAKNVDSDRSGANVHFCNEDIKQVYHKLFDEALERYNAKQKRKDRVIDDYYEKIRQGKQEKLFHEVIFQIGNKDDMNAKSEEGLLAKEILTEFMDEFQVRNPNLYVFSAHLHMDEETPHLHIDFVPYITGGKRGLDTRVSLKSALAAEGFTGGTRGATEWNQWIAAEKQALAMVMERYGVKWLQKGTHEKHLSVLNFEKKERAKKVAELDSQKQEKTTEVAKLNQAVSTMKQELMTTTINQVTAEEAVEKARAEGATIHRDNETLSTSNQQLRVENTSLAKLFCGVRAMCKKLKVRTIEKFKNKFSSIISDRNGDNPIIEINAFMLSDYTEHVNGELYQSFYSDLFGNFVSYLIWYLKKNSMVNLMNRFDDFVDDRAYMRYLQDNDLSVLVGSKYILLNRDYTLREEFDEFLNDYDCIYTSLVRDGLALRKGSVEIYLHDVQVSIRPGTIKDINVKPNKETGKFVYEAVSGMPVEFEENEIKELVHNERKIIEIILKVSINTYDVSVGTIISGEKKQ